MQIWKYKLEIIDTQVIEMPGAVRLLSVQMQGHDLCLWALVDPNADKAERVISIVGTGYDIEMSEASQYIGSAIDGVFVWHVFDLTLCNK